MDTIRENYIKREAQYNAAKYLAEKQFEKQQRRDQAALVAYSIAVVVMIFVAVNLAFISL